MTVGKSWRSRLGRSSGSAIWQDFGGKKAITHATSKVEPVESGDAINKEALDRAIDVVRHQESERLRSLTEIADEAVKRTFCACMTRGEDAAEGRLSDMEGD